jgi:hypothetical protein
MTRRQVEDLRHWVATEVGQVSDLASSGSCDQREQSKYRPLA